MHGGRLAVEAGRLLAVLKLLDFLNRGIHVVCSVEIAVREGREGEYVLLRRVVENLVDEGSFDSGVF